MLAREQVVGQRRGVRQTLQDGVEEAGIAQVAEAPSDTASLLPGHANLLRRKQVPFRQSHSHTQACTEISFQSRSSCFGLGKPYTSSPRLVPLRTGYIKEN